MKGDESGLPHCCGLIAAAAYWYCESRGVAARVLNIRYGEDDGHTAMVFQSSGSRLCIYDAEGSLVLTPDATWDTPPIFLARAYAKFYGVKKRVIAGRWL